MLTAGIPGIPGTPGMLLLLLIDTFLSPTGSCEERRYTNYWMELNVSLHYSFTGTAGTQIEMC